MTADLVSNHPPDRRPDGQHVREHRPDHRREQPIPPAPWAEGLAARMSPRQPGAVALGHLEGDLSARVRGADDEDAAVPELGRIPILTGVQLHEARVEVRRERGNSGAPVRARCHDDLVGLEPAVPSHHDVPARLSGEAVHVDTAANREIEPGRIGLQVAGHLVLRGERPGRRGKGPARQSVVARGGEEAKRVPPPAPGVTDPLVRVQDHEGKTALRQVVARRETGLAAADDHGLDVLCVARATHSSPSFVPIMSIATLRSGRPRRFGRNTQIGMPARMGDPV